jgi:hypothetical protein
MTLGNMPGLGVQRLIAMCLREPEEVENGHA